MLRKDLKEQLGNGQITGEPIRYDIGIDREPAGTMPVYGPGGTSSQPNWVSEALRREAEREREEYIKRHQAELLIQKAESFRDKQKEHENMAVFSNGAARSDRKLRYHLIVPCFKRILAKALTEGEQSYSATNYQKGDYSFAVETFNHLQEHLDKFALGDTSEDHLGHAAANLMFLAFYRDRRPEWFEGGIIKADPGVKGKAE